MDVAEATDFLFAITKEIKQFYEAPVIFLTRKNYSDHIFDALCSLRTALIEGGRKNDMIDIIVDIHLQWIHNVNEIENFKKLIIENEIPREEVYQSISYTIDALNSRLKYFQKYMEKYRPGLSNIEQANLNAEIEIIEDMHKDVTYILLEKLVCFRSFPSDDEFKLHVIDTVDELLTWYDRINDSLSMLLSKFINLNVPHLGSDLTKTLQQIISNINTSNSPSAQRALEELKQHGQEIGTMIRCTVSHSLEMSKVLEKIDVLSDRIRRLESEPASAAVLALTHKKEYLENRVLSLENMKTTLKDLHQEAGLDIEEAEGVGEDEVCVCEDFFKFRIFNHLLPMEEREKLVTELCYLWDLAIFGERSRKSIISILSAAEIKEEFTDEIGNFYIDEYSRKIYKLPNSETLYQPNEDNELVPLTDDAEHIYYFDECGRYFIDSKTRQRVYKAHVAASEYMMDTTGVLLKTKEVRDNVIYHYDNFGRYYINEEGKTIYHDADTVSEYENDGLGNLVRMRGHLDAFELCPADANVTEDFKYLKEAVGPALRVCIAKCILFQPADPIKYLSTSLVKFRENMEIKEKRAREKEALFAEREYIMEQKRLADEAAAREAAILAQGGSEATYDSNLINYTTEDPGDAASSSYI